MITLRSAMSWPGRRRAAQTTSLSMSMRANARIILSSATSQPAAETQNGHAVYRDKIKIVSHPQAAAIRVP